MQKKKFKNYSIFLTLIALLLSLTFLSTPITALAEVMTNGENMEELEAPTLSESAGFQEFGDSKERVHGLRPKL